MDEKISKKPHYLTLSNRSNGMITGVSDVISFDLNAVLLQLFTSIIGGINVSSEKKEESLKGENQKDTNLNK